ncbi:TIM barrel protein [Roseicitreum antarcticum]|nr:TIM barrel protein [Roseicitreum antarcticum]
MRLPRFSANIGFLWKELSFPDRLRAAAAAGFDAVEFHDEAQSSDLGQISDILAETGLPVCGLNVRMGETAGCAAISGHETRARRDVDAALKTAQALRAKAVHVLAGRTGADGDRAAYIKVLRHALDNGDRMILIEPICRAAIDDYFLHDIGMAAEIVQEIGSPRLKIMFDCFHVEMETGPAGAMFQKYANHVGHVQIASVPGRNEPGVEDRLDLPLLLRQMQAAGYVGAFGCEYRPRTSVESGLGWRESFRGAWNA